MTRLAVFLAMVLALAGGATVRTSTADADAVAVAGPVADDLAQLEALRGTQSRDEIDALVDDDAPVMLDVDAATGEVLAAKALPAGLLRPTWQDCASGRC